MPWFSLKRKDSAPMYKKGHLGMTNQMEFVEGKGWIMKGETAPETASSLPPPPKSSKTGLSSTPGAPTTDSDTDSTSGLPGAGRGRGRGGGAGGLTSATSLQSRYAKPPGSAAAAATTTAGLLLPRAGVVTGRGRGRGAGIRTFVPGAPSADSPTASVATSARVFNPYATHTAAPEAQTPTDDAISSLEPSSAPFESSATPPDASSTPLEPSTAEASSTLAQDSQSSVAAYPSSPFANHVPAPSSSAALSAASEGEEAAVVAQQDSSEVVDSAPAVEQDTFAAFLGGNEASEQGISEPQAPEITQGATQEGLLDPEGKAPAPLDDFFGGGDTIQGLDDFGGDIVDPEGTAQDSMLDPEGNLEQPSSQNVAGLQLDASASTQQGNISERVWDEEEMERRAGEAASVLYGGTMDWNSIMGWGQAQKEAGYSEEQVADWLSQYGVDLDVYQYWLAKYYDAAWYGWYQEQYLPSLSAMQSEAPEATSTIVEEPAPTADESSQFPAYDAADDTQRAESAEVPQEGETKPEFESQASAVPSTMAEQGSMFPDTDVMGFDPPPAEESSAVATAEEPASDAQLASTADVLEASTQALSNEEVLGISADYPLSFSLGGESEQPNEISESTQVASDAFAELATHEPAQDSAQKESSHAFQAGAEKNMDVEPGLVGEDSFFEDQGKEVVNGVGTPSNGGLSSMTWSNAAFNLAQSPEQAAAGTSASASPMPKQRSEVGRELSFGDGPSASTASNGTVQHVESLGQWLPKPTDAATRRASTKLSGPLPWDNLSESSEDEWSPRARVKDIVAADEPLTNGASPKADANGPTRAPPPESPSQGKASLLGMTLADQIAFGAKNAQELLQGQGKGVWEQVKGFALPQATPPQLYRVTPELEALYAEDDFAQEPSEHSEGEEDGPARKLDMGPIPNQDRASPPYTPRSVHADSENDSEEAELEPARAFVQKRTGEEELSLTAPMEDAAALESEESIPEALSDGEGWEGFGVEDATQETAESPHAHAESDTKAELDLQPSTMDAPDEATAVSDTISNDKGLAEIAVPAPETTADHAVLLDSQTVQTETGAAFVQEAVEAEEEGWGELDNDVLAFEDDGVPLESAAADVEAEQAPKTVAGDVSVTEVEAAEEEEGSWEGLEEELDLHSAEETHSVEEAQPVETEVPAEETQAAQPADAEVNGAPSAFEGFDQASSERESLLETQVTGLRQQLDAKDAELVELRQQTESSSARELKSLQSELRELRQRLQGAHSSAEQYEQIQEALRQEVSQREQAHKEALEKLATSQASLAERDSELEAVAQQLSSLQAEFKPVKAERDTLQQQLDESEARNDSLSMEYDSMSQQLESLTRQLSSQAKESEQQILALTQSLKQAELGSSKLQEQIKESTADVDRLHVQLQDESSKQEALSQQAAESEAELRHQLKELTQQLQDSKEAHARTSSEHELLTQQLSGRGLEAERVPDSPPGSPARKLQASLEELADLRGKFESAEGQILELQEQVDQLQGAVATAHEAVQEHLSMREKQTERIKKAKGAGPKSLPVVTAEREEAILRADKAEFEMRQLADQRNSLLQQLEAFQNSSPEGFSRTALATDSSAKGLSESAPAKDRSSAGFGPAPESASENSSDLGAQVAELTQQIEAMSARHSALEADLSAAQAKLTEQDSSATQVQELKSALEAATEHAETLIAERDSVQRQLGEEVTKASSHSTDVERLRAECGELEERVQSLEQEAQEQYEACTSKEEECDRVEAQLLIAQQALAATADHASTIEELDALRAQLTSAREQLNASQASAAEELQSVRAQLDSVQSQREASQQSCSNMEDELEKAKAGLQSSRQQLESSVARCDALEQAAQEAAAEAGRVNVNREAEMQQLQEQLRESSRVAEQLQQQVSSAEASRLEAQAALSSAHNRAEELESELEAAVAARDEFVYHLSPQKQRPPLPLGSPAPRANKAQLTAALKAARAHAVELEEQAQEETVGAEEAYLLLGDAEVTIAVLSDVLEDNGMDMDAILDAHMGGDASEEEEEEEGMGPAAAEGPNVEGWLDGSEIDYESPTAALQDSQAQATSSNAYNNGEAQKSPSRAYDNGEAQVSPGNAEEAGQASTSSARHDDDDDEAPGSPSSSGRQAKVINEPLLQEAVSPVVKAIPFMQTAGQDNELSLEGWGGAGLFGNQGAASSPQQTAEGWGDDDLDWLQ